MFDVAAWRVVAEMGYDLNGSRAPGKVVVALVALIQPKTLQQDKRRAPSCLTEAHTRVGRQINGRRLRRLGDDEWRLDR